MKTMNMISRRSFLKAAMAAAAVSALGLPCAFRLISLAVAPELRGALGKTGKKKWTDLEVLSASSPRSPPVALLCMGPN